VRSCRSNASFAEGVATLSFGQKCLFADANCVTAANSLTTLTSGIAESLIGGSLNAILYHHVEV
jgi:hypothetical protein